MADIKDVVDFMSTKGKIFKSVKKMDNALLNTRKKVDIFVCVDVKECYHILFSTEQKSRFLLSHANNIIELEDRVCKLELHNNKYRHILIKNALCSKAKEFLKDRGWKIYNDIV